MSNTNAEALQKIINENPELLKNVNISDILKARATGLSEDASSYVSSKNKAIDEFIKNTKDSEGAKKGVFAFWLIVVVVFVALSVYLLTQGSNDKTTIGVLFGVSLLLHILNLVAVYTNKNILSFLLSVMAFIFGMAFLLRHETAGNLNCATDINTYRVYMATHTFNVVLVFFSLMKLFA
jgi:hypothetical protein